MSDSNITAATMTIAKVAAIKEQKGSLLSDAEYEAHRDFITWCRFYGGFSFGRTEHDFKRWRNYRADLFNNDTDDDNDAGQ